MLALTDFDAILLDMDGTLLDLVFDDLFWNQNVAEALATHHKLTLNEARSRVTQTLAAAEGTLAWYDFDRWSRVFDLDLDALQRKSQSLVSLRPGTATFLDYIAALDKQVFLATDAHPRVLRFKLDVIGKKIPDFETYFSTIVSSFDLQHAKETPEFWDRLCKQLCFAPHQAVLIDDNPAVLMAARRFGIGGQIAVSQPNTHKPKQPLVNFDNVCFLDELVVR